VYVLLTVYFFLSLLTRADDAANVFTGADVMPFGSFESNFYTPWSYLFWRIKPLLFQNPER
jgi:hypothetical protein